MNIESYAPAELEALNKNLGPYFIVNSSANDCYKIRVSGSSEIYAPDEGYTYSSVVVDDLITYHKETILNNLVHTIEFPNGHISIMFLLEIPLINMPLFVGSPIKVFKGIALHRLKINK